MPCLDATRGRHESGRSPVSGWSRRRCPPCQACPAGHSRHRHGRIDENALSWRHAVCAMRHPGRVPLRLIQADRAAINAGRGARPTADMAGDTACIDGRGYTEAATGAAPRPVHGRPPADVAAVYDGAAADDGAGCSARSLTLDAGSGVRCRAPARPRSLPLLPWTRLRPSRSSLLIECHFD